MTTRTLITHALWAAALTLPAAVVGAQPRPAPVPIPAGESSPRQGPDIQPLTLGEPIVGALNRGDYTTPDGTTFDVYHVELEAGVTYHFAAGGHGYDAWVEVRTADGNPLAGIKTATGEHSFTIYNIETAVYSIVVGTNDEGSSGRYILNSGTGEAPDSVASIAVPEGTQPFTGELNEQSEASEQGRYYEYSILDLEAGQTYCLYADSPDDGVFVNCESLEGHPVEFHAIEMEGAFIRFTPTVSGQHALVTLAKQPGQATRYTGYAWVPETGSSETIVDELNAQSIRLDDGTYFDFHEVQLAAGTTYVIDVTSDDFDAVAYLFDADNNQLATNDNGDGTGTNAQITFTPDTSGNYSVGVSAKAARATGGYMARIASGDRIGQDPGVTVTRDREAPHNEMSPIVGRWEAVSIETAGIPSELPAGFVIFVFNADGTSQCYQGGELADESLYQLDGEHITSTDLDGSDPESGTARIDGDTLTLTIESEPGKTVTVTLRRMAGERQAEAPETDPALHGRWECTTVTANGQTNEFPAGSMIFEFLPNGRYRMIQEGQLFGEGTYTTDGENLYLTTEAQDATEHNTYRVRGDEMTLDTVIPPNTPAVAVFRKINE